MKNRRIIISSVCAIIFFASAFPGYAVENPVKDRILLRLSETPVPNIKDRIKTSIGQRVLIGTAKLTAIQESILTVDHQGKSYTVNTGKFDKCTTQLRRRFWGKSELSEFTVGDVLNITGYWADDAKTTINACYIRNTSIQKRYGVFIGEIKSVSDSGFVMTTISDKRSDQTVTFSSTSKFTNRRGERITKSDLAIGNKVRVRGLWDRSANTITEVTEIKNFSLPPLPTGKISITPTPTTASPT